jgi:hypothetical protein
MGLAPTRFPFPFSSFLSRVLPVSPHSGNFEAILHSPGAAADPLLLTVTARGYEAKEPARWLVQATVTALSSMRWGEGVTMCFMHLFDRSGPRIQAAGGES